MSDLSAWLETQGARPAGPGATLPQLTHGSVPEEYAAATARWTLFDRSNLGAVMIEGSDAAAFLTRILAGPVRTLGPGQGERNLLLTPKGKVLHLFDLLATEQGFLCITAPERAAALIADLDMYLFGEDLTCRDASAEWSTIEVTGPEADAALSAAWGGALPANHFDHNVVETPAGSVRVVKQPVAGREGWALHCAPANAKALWQHLVELGALPAGLVVFDSLRSEAGFAAWGADIDDSVYPQEARLENAFSLTKGCYIGQEVVAKIDTYGGLNKRLMLLRVEDDDPVPHGTRLMLHEDGAEARDLGVTTTWAYSFALDGGVVLAYVKRKHQATGTRFQLGATGRFAQVVELPFGEEKPAER